MKTIKAKWVEVTLTTGKDRGYPKEEGQLFIDCKGKHITICEDGDIFIENTQEAASNEPETQ